MTKQKSTLPSKIAKQSALSQQNARKLSAEDLQKYNTLLDTSFKYALSLQNALLRIRELQLEISNIEKKSEELLTESDDVKSQIQQVCQQYEMRHNEYVDTATGNILTVENS